MVGPWTAVTDCLSPDQIQLWISSHRFWLDSLSLPKVLNTLLQLMDSCLCFIFTKPPQEAGWCSHQGHVLEKQDSFPRILNLPCLQASARWSSKILLTNCISSQEEKSQGVDFPLHLSPQGNLVQPVFTKKHHLSRKHTKRPQQESEKKAIPRSLTVTINFESVCYGSELYFSLEHFIVSFVLLKGRQLYAFSTKLRSSSR